MTDSNDRFDPPDSAPRNDPAPIADVPDDPTVDPSAPDTPDDPTVDPSASNAPDDPTVDPSAPDTPHDPTVDPSAPDAQATDTGPASDDVAALARRTNVMVGVLATLLVGACVVIGLLFSRVADAQNDADAVRDELTLALAEGGASSTELDEVREDLARVEAGAALYASQVEGFQETIVELEPQISAGVEEAITGLRDFGESTIEFDVAIDEVIPIDTEVVIKRTVAVPINTEIPINEVIDTTITIDTPLGGIPVDVSVPVDVVVPIDLTVDIPIDETIPISEEFPVQLDVPIAIDVGETELANLTASLATGLESLQDILVGLGG